MATIRVSVTPLSVSIVLTRRCPLECLHCYNNLAMADQEARSQELSKEEHFRLLDDLVDLGCFWLLYTGGEIFARNDFLEIYTYAKRKGFLITLFTNGNLVTERIANYLQEWPPFAIEITLYGRTKDTYEALTANSRKLRALFAWSCFAAGSRPATETEDRSDHHKQARSRGYERLRGARVAPRFQV